MLTLTERAVNLSTARPVDRDVARFAHDDALLRQLYADHGPALLHQARALLGGDTERARDLVQETLLRAWRHPEALASAAAHGRSPRGWLMTVTRNLAVDQHRAQRARPAEVPVDGIDPGREDARLDQALTAYEIAEALQSLSAEHRAVIDALYFQDRSVTETAELQGVPIGTVKSRAYYALRALRAACEERGLLP